MRIVADENISGVRELCGQFGPIELVDGRQLLPAQLRQAEILLVRSVTHVDEALLANSPVSFVGSATAGVDHIDVDYLARRGIQFADAAGANAVAVAEYVVACCLAYCVATARSPQRLTVGIVGYGHVGTATAQRLRALGMQVLINDPPRAAREGGALYSSLVQALSADVVSLHVPLTAAGDYPTRALIGAQEIAALGPQALLINAARGGVADEAAWLAALPHRRRLALDCWCDEPEINRAVLASAWIATPHIAGHTVDARWRATHMLARAVAQFVGAAAVPSLWPEPVPVSDLRAGLTTGASLNTLVVGCCDPLAWTAEMKRHTALEIPFDQLRRQFGVRREFASYTIRAAALDPALRAAAQALGFQFNER